MARVSHSLTMDVPPAKAQEMFLRDIVPDLHRDAGFWLYREEPGELRLSDADPMVSHGVGGGSALAGRRTSRGLDALADPDMYEVHDEEAGEPALADALRRGGAEDEETREIHTQRRSLSLLLSMRLKVTFKPQGDGTRVLITGRAEERIRDGLCRLGRPDHWPAIADAPHD